jgi:uncharacterized protein YaaN involved in tellurite resistance
MIDHTGQLLQQQTARVQEDAVSAGVSLQTLQHAFDNVFATMDAIDGYRTKAVESMGATVHALEQQIERSRSYVDRSHSTSS